jgi:hypothetical protein
VSHHVTLDAAETRPSITKFKFIRAEIDLLSGTFELHFTRVDSGGNETGSGSCKGTLGATDLTTVIQKMSDQAQAEGAIPAGTFGQG